jgi:hypothetical protein
MRATRWRAEYLDPNGDRYGIPTFPWRSAPAGYATARQLRELGLRPGGQEIAAQVLWRGIGGTRTAYLYRIDAAKPKRIATARQWAAIERALLARRRCATCTNIRPYYIPRSLGECLTCANV